MAKKYTKTDIDTAFEGQLDLGAELEKHEKADMAIKEHLEKEKKEEKNKEKPVIKKKEEIRFFDHWNKYGVYVLLLIVLITGFSARTYVDNLPIIEGLTKNIVKNYYQQQLMNDINAKYSLISAEEKQKIYDKEINGLLKSEKTKKEIKTVTERTKEAFKDSSGQTYLFTYQSYFYLSKAEEIMKGDEGPFISHLIVYFYKIIKIFDSDATLMKAAYYLPVFLGLLLLIVIFKITYLIANKNAAFFAGIIAALHPAVVRMTMAGSIGIKKSFEIGVSDTNFPQITYAFQTFFQGYAYAAIVCIAAVIAGILLAKAASKFISFVESLGVGKEYLHKKITAAAFIIIIFAIVLFFSHSNIVQAANTTPVMDDTAVRAIQGISNEADPRAYILGVMEENYAYDANTALQVAQTSELGFTTPEAYWASRFFMETDESKASEILKMLACDDLYITSVQNISCDKEKFVVVSDKALNSFPYLFTFSNWDFTLAEIHNSIKGMNPEQATAMIMQKYSKDKNQALSLYYEALEYGKLDYDNFSILSSGRTCNNFNSTLYCGQFFRLDMKKKKAYDNTNKEMPYFLVNKTVEQGSAENEYTLIIFEDNEMFRFVAVKTPLKDTMFIRMLYLNGYGLRKFNLTNIESDLISQKIAVYKEK